MSGGVSPTHVYQAQVYQAQQVPAGLRLKLDANEGPPPDPAWFAGLTPESMARYPEPALLERRLGERLGVEPERVLVTAGGDEAIDRFMRVVLSARPGGLVAVATPTFEMIPRYAAMSGGAVRETPWPDGSTYPLGQVLDSIDPDVAALALVTPNNPTGGVVTRAQAAAVTARAGVPVLLDLAYTEFAEDDLTDLALSCPGVVAVRTFSKAWGLAGARVGYAVGDRALIAAMRARGGPYSVGAAGLALAAAVLDLAPAVLAERVGQVVRLRAALARLVHELGFRAAESQGNFVLARRADAGEVWTRLRAAGVLVRRWTDRPGLADALRITCPANDQQMRTLDEALRHAAGEAAR